jgi:hypothetical protein
MHFFSPWLVKKQIYYREALTVKSQFCLYTLLSLQELRRNSTPSFRGSGLIKAVIHFGMGLHADTLALDQLTAYLKVRIQSSSRQNTSRYLPLISQSLGAWLLLGFYLAVVLIHFTDSPCVPVYLHHDYCYNQDLASPSICPVL